MTYFQYFYVIAFYIRDMRYKIGTTISMQKGFRYFSNHLVTQ